MQPFDGWGKLILSNSSLEEDIIAFVSQHWQISKLKFISHKVETFLWWTGMSVMFCTQYIHNFLTKLTLHLFVPCLIQFFSITFATLTRFLHFFSSSLAQSFNSTYSSTLFNNPAPQWRNVSTEFHNFFQSLFLLENYNVSLIITFPVRADKTSKIYRNFEKFQNTLKET